MNRARYTRIVDHAPTVTRREEPRVVLCELVPDSPWLTAELRRLGVFQRKAVRMQYRHLRYFAPRDRARWFVARLMEAGEDARRHRERLGVLAVSLPCMTADGCGLDRETCTNAGCPMTGEHVEPDPCPPAGLRRPDVEVMG